MELMNTDDFLQRSIAQMLQIQIQRNPSMAPFENIMLGFLNKHMSYQQLKPELVNIYAKAFSDEELQEIITFYKSTTGAKSINLLPDLMQQSAQLGATRVRENIAELEQQIQVEVTRLEQLENTDSDGSSD